MSRGQEGSPSPTTTASQCRIASCGTAVAWRPPITVLTPRSLYRSNRYASGAFAVNVEIAATSHSGSSTSSETSVIS